MHVAAASNDVTRDREMAKNHQSPLHIAPKTEFTDIKAPVATKDLNGSTSSTADNATSLQTIGSPPRDLRFTIFAQLPVELRYLIWRQAFLEHLEDQSCVCIYQGGTISDDPDINGTKSTGGSGQRYNHSIPQVHPESFPLELVSREARTVCLYAYAANQKWNSNLPPTSEEPAKLEGESGSLPTILPFRVFNPEKDTLYIDRRKRHGDGSTIVFYLGDRTLWVQHVKHVAIPFSIAIDIARHPSLLQHLKSLERISLVFPPATNTAAYQGKISTTRSSNHVKAWSTRLWSSLLLPIPTPSRRVRLQVLSPLELSRLEINDDPRRPSMLNGRPWNGGTASEFIELVKQSIGNRIRRTDQFSRGLQAFYWSKEDGGFRIAVEGCVFG